MPQETTSHPESVRAAASPAMPFDRTAGLSASAIRLLKETHIALQQRKWDEVERPLTALIALAPAHPEVLRVRAAVAHLKGHADQSIELLQGVLAARPYDAQAMIDLGSALAKTGDSEGAINVFRRAAQIEPRRVAPLLGLAQVLEHIGEVEQSVAILREAVEREPENVTASNLFARALHFAGRIDEAQREHRRTLARAPASALAWYGLSTLNTVRLDADDLASIEALLMGGGLRETDSVALSFALAKAQEDNERYQDAFRTLTAANAARRRQLRWDAAKFSANVRVIEKAFAAPIAAAPDESLGSGILFIVGMPRSGSTLIEQMLAAHPDVATGGELDDVRDIVRDESQHRERDFPEWVAVATNADWQRLGQAYLDRTSHRRGTRRVFTDKALLNWRYIGAIQAMLPGARFIDCRRDAVETCLSCYRQLFSNELAFTYDLAELASFWHDYDGAMRFWQQRYPDRILEVVHEKIIADAKIEIRRLLDFCGLPFDEACLRFHEGARAVRTASAAQVREPLRRDTSRAARYGTLLDPLRKSLGS